MDAGALVALMPAAIGRELGAKPDIAARVASRMAEARARYPELAGVSDAAFTNYLVERAGPVAPADAAATALALADDLHHADLLLACGCAAGDPASIRAFRNEHFASVRAAVARAADASARDEIVQRVLQRLFVGAGRRGAAITRYSGRGSLGGWLKVLAVREAHDSRRKRSDTPVSDADRLADRAVSIDDPEVAHLKRRYRSQFKQAFQRAFAELSPRERNIMRLEWLDGLNIDQIGALHGVHRATVARWRVAARQSLHAATRRIFLDELAVTTSEFDSILRLIESQLEVSLPRLLRKTS